MVRTHVPDMFWPRAIPAGDISHIHKSSIALATHAPPAAPSSRRNEHFDDDGRRPVWAVLAVDDLLPMLA